MIAGAHHAQRSFHPSRRRAQQRQPEQRDVVPELRASLGRIHRPTGFLHLRQDRARSLHRRVERLHLRDTRGSL